MRNKLFPNNFTALINRMDEGVLVLDEERTVILANRAAGKILGSKALHAARACIDTLLAETNRPFCAFLEEVAGSGADYTNHEITYRRRNREARLLVSAFTRTETAPARGRRVYVLLRDITRLWRLHTKEKQLMAQVRKNYTIQMENLRQIAESVAHEVRNPIVSIGGYANLLLRKIEADSTPTEEHRKYLTYIKEDAERLLALVGKVERYTDTREMHFRKENVLRVLRESISFAKRLGARTGVRVEAPTVEPGEYLIYVDMTLLKTAFKSLVRQAVVLSNGDDTVSIHLHVNTLEIIFSIDIATKLIKENIPFLFNPFYSASGQRLNFDLANAQRVIMLHGGMIRADWGGEGRLTLRLSMPREKRLLRP